MKQIEATIKPSQFSEVKEALMNLGVEEITVTEVKGFGRQGYTEIYHGAQYSIDFLPEVKIQILIPDEKVAKLVEAITTNAAAAKLGYGKILITPVEGIIRI
jgi:nitrogen regulatory protein P-II 1